ncbi:MAG: cytidine deaminase [Buchananella hordeovulneris]|nr:cytidine deaminase [Buchananella hordeovulneris]
MIDFDVLLEHARTAGKMAYAPYSGFPVGAAALVDDGRVVTGCNVENASLGLTLCAECGLVSDLIRGGGGKLVLFTCVGPDGEPVSPCGRCRQLLWEHAAPNLRLLTPLGVEQISAVLPGAFGPAQLLGDDVAAGRPAGESQ